MDKNKETKAISQFAGLLLCILLIQSAFAAENQNQFTMVFINNSTSENATIENSTMENSSTENPIIENATIEDPIGENTTIEDPIIGNTTIQNSIYPPYSYSYLTAGYSTEFTVSFTNNGNESLLLTPKIITTNETNSLNESWIIISPANATVAPHSAQYFTIEENIPWDAAGGYNTNKIAFTDDIAPYTEGYYTDIEYVNQMYLYTYVYGHPKIELQTSYISDTVDAGTENEYKIKIKNVAPRDITINPTLSTPDEYNTYQKQAFGNDAIKIFAPSTIKAGEIANITIRANVPENATGTYNNYIDMNVNGRANDGSVPQLSLNFKVWKAPAPFVKTFYTSTDTPITIEVSGNMYSSETGYRVSQKKDKPPFELGLTCNSIPVNMTFEESAESGGAEIQDYYYYYYSTWADEYQRVYRNINDHYVATYKAPGAIGEWQLTILPKGVRNFQYLIKIKENNREEIWNVTSENIDSGDSSTENVINENASTISTEMPVADFNSNVTHGSSRLSVQFTDLSENATEFCWDFGDNTYSTSKNPVHTYDKMGKYTVSLTVKNENGIDTEKKSKYIWVSKK
ncbi:PKD domain-containing protein [Methanosarcina sp.]|uniref:PKD domain-containing protein n=1 Tax=Methanosarcina sp. TaxID=2213 RepID=UPI003C781587